VKRPKPTKYVCEHIPFDSSDTASVSVEKIRSLSLPGNVRMCPECARVNKQALAGGGSSGR
jgi:hypothetical protein